MWKKPQLCVRDVPGVLRRTLMSQNLVTVHHFLRLYLLVEFNSRFIKKVYLGFRVFDLLGD